MQKIYTVTKEINARPSESSADRGCRDRGKKGQSPLFGRKGKKGEEKQKRPFRTEKGIKRNGSILSAIQGKKKYISILTRMWGKEGCSSFIN